MKVVLFTDTHFGIRHSSQIWFNHQIQFVREQLIPKIRKLQSQEPTIAVHLGDVFDSRSSLNTMIAMEVRKVLEEVASACEHLYIIPGNHDYFSETTSEYCTPSLVLQSVPGLTVIEKETVLKWGSREVCLYPWPDQKELSVSDYTQKHPDRIIFTHADLVMEQTHVCSPVFSGHIHTPLLNENIRNLGSCFPIDFHDSNQLRYFYIWDPETDELQAEPNNVAIRFWRLYGEEISRADLSKFGIDDYLEIYLTAPEIQAYQKEVERFKEKIKNTRIVAVPMETEVQPIDIMQDIESIIRQNIPDRLINKFKYIQTRVADS